MEQVTLYLQKLGLRDKEISTYLALLSLGPTSIRKIAEKTRINRGTVHLSLRSLQKSGLVSYYHKDKKQHFVAENPKILVNVLAHRREELEEAESDLQKIIPELATLGTPGNNRPAVKYYDDYSGIRTILEDALDTAEKTKEYVAFSSSAISPHLYHKKAFPKFTEERMKRKIFVRTIASGPGGSIHGQDERRWLTKAESAPVYKLIYGGKVAMVSVGKNGIPHGLIIEDEGIYKTELLIFNSLWKFLGK